VGGLARRAAFLAKERPDVIVDCGNIVTTHTPDASLAAELALKAMDRMRYDVLGIGEGELALGLQVLKNLVKTASFPFLCSNLYSPEGLWDPYVVLKKKGVKIGVLSVISPGLLPQSIHCEVQPPLVAIRRLLPTIRGKTDLVILLSHLPYKETLALIGEIDGVDVVIIGHGCKRMYPRLVEEKVVMASPGCRGIIVGLLNLDISTKTGERIRYLNGRLVLLGPLTPGDPDIEEMLKPYREVLSRKRRHDPRERAKKMVKEMTPEEFINYLKQRGGVFR